MNKEFNQLLERYSDEVHAVLNILTESAYFYCSDNENIFYFLRRHEATFSDFFKTCFNWELITDDKCARLYKDKIYNDCRETKLVLFQLRGRDEYIAFMLLLEFYEKLLDQDNMTTSDRENPRFRFGDLLGFEQQRFCELFPEREELKDAEIIRKKILRDLMPKLCDYRFLSELERPAGARMNPDHYIYEALPALYHYNSAALEKNIKEISHVLSSEDTGSSPEKEDSDGDTQNAE